MHFKIRRGLDIPIVGEPEQTITDGRQVGSVAVIGNDYLGLKPTMLVAEGEEVKLGQALFEDKKNPGVRVTAPGSGTVKQIRRGDKRALQSVVIELDGDEALSFDAPGADGLETLKRERLRALLQESGMWTAFRTRPYSRVPAVGSQPRSIFVTAIDTNPLAADPAVIIKRQAQAFQTGVAALTHLTDGEIYLCAGAESDLPAADLPRVVTARFSGPHPAGLPGTHIHLLDPVRADKTVWHIGYQDVIALGELVHGGRVWTERVVALGGPLVKRPRLIRTRLGANTEELLTDEVERIDSRVISGSILSGRRAVGPVSYLGRYHVQVSVLREGRDRELFGWIRPGAGKFSAINVFVSSLFRGRRFPLSTSQNGSPRAMVPIGNYEQVVPLDVLPTPLLRSLLVRDTDQAQKLGCLELDEEDLALCSFVCAGKYDFGPVLRSNLTQIEREG